MPASPALLSADDPAPFTVYRAEGASPYVLIADHAGQRVPRGLSQLGLPQSELDRHIGWDIGIGEVTRLLAEALDATAVVQTYSRLVIDCNRRPGAATSIPSVSDGTTIPGNQDLSPDEAARRAAAIFHPYHARIEAELESRRAAGRAAWLLSLHSFTPHFGAQTRPWHTGVMYMQDTRFAHALRDALAADPELVVGDNQPYGVNVHDDYAVPVYGEARGLVHVALEIRQDQIGEPAGQRAWAARLAQALRNLHDVLASFG